MLSDEERGRLVEVTRNLESSQVTSTSLGDISVLAIEPKDVLWLAQRCGELDMECRQLSDDYGLSY